LQNSAHADAPFTGSQRGRKIFKHWCRCIIF